MTRAFAINWKNATFSGPSDSISCDSSYCFFSFCSACQNTIIILKQESFSFNVVIQARSERQTMASKTKIIIITSDEDLIQEISARTNTNTHIIDLNATAKPNQDSLADLSEVVCIRGKNNFIVFENYFRILKSIVRINELFIQLLMNRQE